MDGEAVRRFVLDNPGGVVGTVMSSTGYRNGDFGVDSDALLLAVIVVLHAD